MKTIREYEPSDIDLNDKLNTTIILAISLSAMLFDPGTSHTDEEIDKVTQNVVAAFLNILDRAGYVITSKEVPAAFEQWKDA